MYVVFNETIANNRRNGARGGRAFARNQRLRKLLAPPTPLQAPREDEPPETAHEACLLLDRQFPWLADAFASKRRIASRSHLSCFFLGRIACLPLDS